MWLASGVNRLTIGIQTLDNRMLRFLGRPHTCEQAIALLESPPLKQFSSVGIDIIYGLPGQTTASLEQSLQQLLRYNIITHISAYELTLSGKTPLGRHKKLLPRPGENALADMQLLLHEMLSHNGFEHYEVSNYAKVGFRCRHNMACWAHKPYIGLGPSAHSFMPPMRYANCADTAAYITRLSKNEPAADFQERLSQQQFASEMIMLALRTADGLDENRFEQACGEAFCTEQRKRALDAFVEKGFLVYEPPVWKPTAQGLLRADALARELA
jgi:oxygen-independent coproporphyrinogen-3 oxidase